MRDKKNSNILRVYPWVRVFECLP